jgi:putative pantetheine hydrolase
VTVRPGDRYGGWYGSITDVAGIRVGQAQRVGDGWLTGVTVVLPPPGAVGAVDVRGGGPGTHETDALDPTTLVPTVDAVCLTGGSAYGLAAAGGVQHWCEEQGRGFGVGPVHDRRSLLVPIVPAAAVFDLGRGGDPRSRPDAALGYAAAQDTATQDAAGTGGLRRGCAGAGTGTLMAAGRLRGGVGTASVRLPGDLVVGAIAVVNAAGSPADRVTGALLATAFIPAGLPRPLLPAPEHARALGAQLAPQTPPAAGGMNTTLAVVATNAQLSPAMTRRTATTAHDGLARGLNPVHTLHDGDTVFALATGTLPVPEEVVPALNAAAADAVLLAVLDAVLAAGATRTPAIDVPGYLDLCPSAGACLPKTRPGR